MTDQNATTYIRVQTRFSGIHHIKMDGVSQQDAILRILTSLNRGDATNSFCSIGNTIFPKETIRSIEALNKAPDMAADLKNELDDKESA